MPRWLQIVLHLSTVAVGSYAAFSTGTPLPLVLSGGVNTALGAIAQTYNTDGTNQATPFVDKGKGL